MDPVVRDFTFYSFQLREISKLIDDLHFFVKPTLLRQIADAVLHSMRHRLTKELDLACVRCSYTDDHPDRRGLSGAVWAKKAEHTSGSNLKTKVLHGSKFAKALCNVGNAKGGFKGSGIGHLRNILYVRRPICNRWLIRQASVGGVINSLLK